jgi:hypothetical protein
MLSLRALAIGTGNTSRPTISLISSEAATTTSPPVSFAFGGPAGERTTDAVSSARLTSANSVAAFRVCFACARFLDRIDLVAFESSFLRGDFDLIAPGVDGLLGAAEAAL